MLALTALMLLAAPAVRAEEESAPLDEAKALIQAGDYAGAEDAARELLGPTEAELGMDHPKTADETALKGESAGRRILHLATHGFSLDGSCGATRAGIENPLLLSGVVLAGANRRAAGTDGEDGILTAEELAALDRLRKRKVPPHPYLWSGFVAAGDWR